jgi:hypothetical protein
MIQARNRVIWSYGINGLHDTTVDYDDSVITFLVPETDIDARKQLVGAYYHTRQYDLAEEVLTDMEISAEDAETQAFKELYTLLINVAQDGRNPYRFTRDEWDMLEAMIEAGGTSAAESAKGLFALVKGERYDMYVERVTDEPMHQQALGDIETLKTPAKLTTLTVYPNPASQSIQIHYAVKEYEGNVSLRLTDISGRLLESRSRQAEEGDVKWNTARLAAGVYFVQLCAGDKVVSVHKIMIQH